MFFNCYLWLYCIYSTYLHPLDRFVMLFCMGKLGSDSVKISMCMRCKNVSQAMKNCFFPPRLVWSLITSWSNSSFSEPLKGHFVFHKSHRENERAPFSTICSCWDCGVWVFEFHRSVMQAVSPKKRWGIRGSSSCICPKHPLVLMLIHSSSCPLSSLLLL